MALTRERKILLGSVGLALGALIVDRVILGEDDTGPARAEAAMVSTVAATATAPTPAAAGGNRAARSAAMTTPALMPQGPSLAQRLETVSSAEGLVASLTDAPDAFAMPAEWVPPTVDEQVEAAPSSASLFRQAHRLEAVMLGGGVECAIVNGKPIKVGQQVAGFELVSVSQRTARFRGQGTIIELTLETQSAD